MQRAIPPGDRLAAVLLTHAHFDHVGALPALLRAHPDAAVVVHEREAPFLTGEAQYPYMPPGSVAQRVLLAIGIVPSKFVQARAGEGRLFQALPRGAGRAWGLQCRCAVPAWRLR